GLLPADDDQFSVCRILPDGPDRRSNDNSVGVGGLRVNCHGRSRVRAFPQPGDRCHAMNGRTTGRPWEQPFAWWGPPWARPNLLSLADLIAQGVINAEKVAWLADHVRRGRSVVVAALRSGTGKSTLAHALIAEVDPERSRVYVRGSYEPFDWLASSDPNRTTILVNEISDHLPVYCWGVCAKRVL